MRYLEMIYDNARNGTNRHIASEDCEDAKGESTYCLGWSTTESLSGQDKGTSLAR
jgi:hypothetical protein